MRARRKIVFKWHLLIGKSLSLHLNKMWEIQTWSPLKNSVLFTSTDKGLKVNMQQCNRMELKPCWEAHVKPTAHQCSSCPQQRKLIDLWKCESMSWKKLAELTTLSHRTQLYAQEKQWAYTQRLMLSEPLCYFAYGYAWKVQSSVKTFTLTPRRISGSYAGATHDGACFIFNLCIFIEVFVLFFPMRRLEASGIRSLSYGKTFSTLNLLKT